jgi:hypothetical protein
MSPSVRWIRDVAHRRERRQIANQHRLGLLPRDPRALGPCLAAGVEHDHTHRLGQGATRHQAAALDACSAHPPYAPSPRWEADARFTLAAFRIDAARAGDCPEAAALATELQATSADLCRLWGPTFGVRAGTGCWQSIP